MGSESCNSESESSNSGKKDKLEKMEMREENANTIINRVWIAKRSINVKDDDHVQALNLRYLEKISSIFGYIKKLSLDKPKQNVFNIKGEIKWKFKHWSIILELSNNSYVNIQFGRNGISLKEFDQTNCDGENVLNAIIDTWGEETHPYSFCYLGEANFSYEILKKVLEEKKKDETKIFNEKGSTYYNAFTRNCQNFSEYIEKIIFKNKKFWHSFNYYIDDFFSTFFPNIDINNLKMKYENDLKLKNEELFKLNAEKINTNYQVMKKIEQNVKKRYRRRNLDFDLDETNSKIMKELEMTFCLTNNELSIN